MGIKNSREERKGITSIRTHRIPSWTGWSLLLGCIYMMLNPEKHPKFYETGISVGHTCSAGFLQLLCQKLPIYVAVIEGNPCEVTYFSPDHIHLKHKGKILFCTWVPLSWSALHRKQEHNVAGGWRPGGAKAPRTLLQSLTMKWHRQI